MAKIKHKKSTSSVKKTYCGKLHKKKKKSARKSKKGLLAKILSW